jgi:hypothetical protein
MVVLTNWHSRQDLLVSLMAELSIPSADSNKVSKLWPQSNLWHPMAALLLQWAPTEAWEDPAATPSAFKSAISWVLDCLLEEHHISAFWMA